MAERLVQFRDYRTGVRFELAVPDTSPWYDLLSDGAAGRIRAETAEDVAARERYRAAGGVITTPREKDSR